MSSVEATVIAVGPLSASAPLPCPCAVWSSGLVVLRPLYSYIASQGRCLQRDGRVEVRFEDDAIWLGGHAVTCIEGTLNVGSADHPQ